MFGFWVSFDTQYVVFIVLRYHSILDMFYVMFQGYRFGVLMVIVYKLRLAWQVYLRPAILQT